MGITYITNKPQYVDYKIYMLWFFFLGDYLNIKSALNVWRINRYKDIYKIFYKNGSNPVVFYYSNNRTHIRTLITEY